MKQTAY